MRSFRRPLFRVMRRISWCDVGGPFQELVPVEDGAVAHEQDLRRRSGLC